MTTRHEQRGVRNAQFRQRGRQIHDPGIERTTFRVRGSQRYGSQDTGVDSDTDGAADCIDCALLDNTAYGLPTAVENLEVTQPSSTQIAWTDQNIGSGTDYAVVSGEITALGSMDFTLATCLASPAMSPAVDAGPDPALGAAKYYMVKPRNSCGVGTYGTAARDLAPACP